MKRHWWLGCVVVALGLGPTALTSTGAASAAELLREQEMAATRGSNQILHGWKKLTKSLCPDNCGLSCQCTRVYDESGQIVIACRAHKVNEIPHCEPGEAGDSCFVRSIEVTHWFMLGEPLDETHEDRCPESQCPARQDGPSDCPTWSLL